MPVETQSRHSTPSSPRRRHTTSCTGTCPGSPRAEGKPLGGLAKKQAARTQGRSLGSLYLDSQPTSTLLSRHHSPVEPDKPKAAPLRRKRRAGRRHRPTRDEFWAFTRDLGRGWIRETSAVPQRKKGDARTHPHRRGRRSDQGFPPDSRYATGTPPAPELAAKAADLTQPEGRSEQRRRRSSTFRSGAEGPRHDHHPPNPRRPSSRRLRPSHPAHAACRRGCAASPSGAAAPESAVLRAETQRREASPPPSSAAAGACQASLRWRRGEEV